MTDAPDGSRPLPRDSDAGGIQPRSLRIGLVWTGIIVIVLLLLTPTLGSHGSNSEYYRGDHFTCMPALGPTTSYYLNMWEEWPDSWEDSPGTHAANAAREDAEVAFEVAVCGEQRSRRIGWALVVAIPTLAIALTGRRSPAPASNGSSDVAGQG